ncbi:putative apyrase 6 [Bienertia sinuspersici]
MPNPCYPKGYELMSQASDGKPVKSQATGNFSACKSKLTMLLNGRKVLLLGTDLLVQLKPKHWRRVGHLAGVGWLREEEEEGGGGGCSWAVDERVDEWVVVIWGLIWKRREEVMVFELRGLVPKASISELESVARHFCEDDWENLKNQYDIDDADLSRSCFSHTFMVILLHNRFGLPFDEKRVELAAGSTPVDWRLGAFISQTIMKPLVDITVHHDTHIIENDSVTYFFLFAVLIVFVLLAAFFVMKLRKPQFKTIYDLEKGRYIVTRVPR